MTVFKRMISALLLCVMVLGCVACGGGDDEDQGQGESIDFGETPDRFDPNLPEKDFEGMDFTFAVRGVENDPSAVDNELAGTDIVADASGDTIDQAVYQRNMYLKDRYNVNIKSVFCGNTGVETSGSDMYLFVEKSIASGERAFDAILSSPYDTVGYIYAGFLRELQYLSYVDFEREWWDQNALKDLKFGNRLFMVTGEVTIIDNISTEIIVFNKDMIKDLGLDNPYEVVTDGKWTLEKLYKDSQVATNDFGGDGVWNERDTYGLYTWQNTMISFLCSCGVTFGVVDQDGQPELTLYSERADDVWTKVLNLTNNKVAFDGYNSRFKPDAGMEDMFERDQFLYAWATIGGAMNLRMRDVDFGIIPLPKYNEDQQEYISSPTTYSNTFLSVPISTNDMESTGFILEAFSAKSAELVTPAFYEITLKGKTAQDVDSVEMLDLIFATKRYDVGRIFTWGGYQLAICDAYNLREANFTSFYKRYEAQAKKDMKTLAAILE